MWIFPLVLGTGKRLFGDGAIPAALTLIDSKVSKTGVTLRNLGTWVPDLQRPTTTASEATQAR